MGLGVLMIRGTRMMKGPIKDEYYKAYQWITERMRSVWRGIRYLD